ncbi:hypothetical protein [Serinibacter arcticus]|uniref:Cytoplasmic axial filament protein CafA and Ribonuclease G n=1 Tax=Serinibacter arcticus TaxID=1655435 RepID=A0A4Z1E0X3_9MICO|nr:hypothetical protein [Serinibacter arcticus]TGO04322.1 Cytoplasmic axial filament protein CafA and Ribonuclease G [Serinibacter arcticus]
MSTEDSNRTLGERRRRRLEAARAAETATPTTEPTTVSEPSPSDTAELTATGPISAIDGDGPPTAGGTPSRRQLREARQREEEARRAAAGATADAEDAAPEIEPAPAAPVRVARADRTASLPPVAPARPEAPAAPVEDQAGPTPSGRTPNRRSMRDRRVEGPAGPAGRGERVPAQRPVVRTPAAAQGIRRVDETGALTGVTSTRATEDSPIEVTGPIDWSSSLEVASPVEPEPAAPATPTAAPVTPEQVEPAPPVVPPRASLATPPADAVTPARRSVLAAGRTAQPAWESVTGEGRGAAVPQPEESEVPDVEGVFDVVPEELEAEAADGIDVGSDDGARPLWVTWAGFVLLALVGVGIGVGIYLAVT